jgi:hypothetical protein
MHFDLSEAAAVAWTGNLARFDLYGSIHKALRLRMSELMVATGRLDCADDAEVSTLCNELARFLDFCISHLEHENAFIHPALEARAVCSSRRIAEEHVDHERDIATLRRCLRALETAAPEERPALARSLYQTLALFMAHNLHHMYLEETDHNRTLWQHYSDAELASLHATLLTHVSPDNMAYAMRYMLPAMTPQERAATMAGVRAGAPAEAFAGLMSLAQDVLPPGAFAALDLALNSTPSP